MELLLQADRQPCHAPGPTRGRGARQRRHRSPEAASSGILMHMTSSVYPVIVRRRDNAGLWRLIAVMRALPGLLRQVDQLLRGWKARAQTIPDRELRQQALNSLHFKRFHCEGGAVFALLDGAPRASVLRYIIALQTISDYLDNLCDRAPGAGGEDFRQLHAAMGDSVQPSAAAGGGPVDYYRLHPQRDDGGYLRALVAACRAEVATLPAVSRASFTPHATELMGQYADLQRLKHLPDAREAAVRQWAEPLALCTAPRLDWWEMAAATGSTLGVFALFACAAGGEMDTQMALDFRRAYFPWVTGLHILLDYWIDREEDLRGGDMNFTRWYRTPAAAARRFCAFGRQAAAAVAGLPDPAFHRLVVQGLPALYLTDPKVRAQGLQREAWHILRAAGPSTWILYWAVRWLRARGALRPAAGPQPGPSSPCPPA